MRRTLMLAVATIAVLASGCSITTTSDVGQSELEQSVASVAANHNGWATSDVSVTCNGGLNATVGATQTCQVSHAGDTVQPVTVTATAISDGNLQFDVKTSQ